MLIKTKAPVQHDCIDYEPGTTLEMDVAQAGALIAIAVAEAAPDDAVAANLPVGKAGKKPAV